MGKKLRFSAGFFMVFSDFFSWFFAQIFQIFADFLPAGYERSYVTEWTLNARPADQFSTIFRRFFRDFSALFRNFLAQIFKVFSLFFLHFFCTFWRKICAFFCTFRHFFSHNFKKLSTTFWSKLDRNCCNARLNPMAAWPGPLTSRKHR